MTIKIYTVNDVDWVAGDFTAEGALAYYQASIETTLDEDELVLPVVLTEEEMNTYLFVDEDGKKFPFAQVLQEMIDSGQTFPCLFASTEY